MNANVLQARVQFRMLFRVDEPLSIQVVASLALQTLFEASLLGSATDTRIRDSPRVLGIQISGPTNRRVFWLFMAHDLHDGVLMPLVDAGSSATLRRGP